MAVKGMDTSTGRTVVPLFADLGNTVKQQVTEVYDLVQSAEWTGDDAERYLNEFEGVVSRAEEVASRLTALGEELQQHVAGQDQTSAG